MSVGTTKWKVTVDHVDWREDEEMTQEIADKLYEKYHNKVLIVECDEEDIEVMISEEIVLTDDWGVDEVEFTYTRA